MPKGYKHSEEAKRRIGLAQIGNTNRLGAHHTDAFKAKRKLWSVWPKGKTIPYMLGAGNPNWKGGVTPRHLYERTTLQYKKWRTSVFERDDYTCVWCGKHGGELNADHIKRFSEYPELRLVIDNGRTLCVPCHKTTFKHAKK